MEEKLELLIITYNRAGHLARTLAQLLESPFARCQITVLDNSSTDHTPLVCKEYQSLFENMRVARHRKNIGACANYLRAVEMSESVYTWVLCDDDVFDFSDCADVIAVIESETFDLISFGSAGKQFAVDEAKHMASAEAKAANFIFMSSFLPSLIFRTALFDSGCLAKGYRNAANLYPHFEFLKRCVERNYTVYNAKKQIIRRNDDENILSALQWLTLWVNSCRYIGDRKLRRLTIYRATEGRFGAAFFKRLAVAVAAEKMLYPDRVYRELVQLLLGLSADQRLALGVAAPLALIPSSVYKAMRKLKHRLRGRNYANANADEPLDFFRL